MNPSNTTGHDWEPVIIRKKKLSTAAKEAEYLASYFDTAKNNPSELGQFYRGDSLFSFQRKQTQGEAGIANRLNSKPLKQYIYKIGEVDYQASPGTGGMLASFSGLVQIIGEERAAHSFTRVFHLMPTPEGSCYVQNDMLCVESA